MAHGVYVEEQSSLLSAPQKIQSGIQFVVGTAPIHLTSNPEKAVNVPIMCQNLTDAKEKLGYDKEEMERYTLCQSMFWNFEIFKVQPVIFVNVLNPEKHTKDIEEMVEVKEKQAVLKKKDVLLNSIEVSVSGENIMRGTDYLASFNDEGYLLITLLDGGTVENVSALNVKGKQLDVTKVTYQDIIGGYDVVSGKESGLQLLRRVYPMFNVTAATIIAPGFSHIPAVGAAMQAICEKINGNFRAECIIDLDCENKCKNFGNVLKTKMENGFVDKHAYVVWPMVLKDGMVLYASGNAAAVMQYSDARNGGIPNVSPSNKDARIDGAVLADGTEVFLDFEQADSVNGSGVATFINVDGWKLWGNYTAAYPDPDITDPKDKFLSTRRFFSWHGNNFITKYLAKCDNPSNKKLIDTIVDEENVICNGYVSAGICAGASIELDSDKNSIDNLIGGKLYFKQKLTPYPPAQEIVNTLCYDPEALNSLFEGGMNDA